MPMTGLGTDDQASMRKTGVGMVAEFTIPAWKRAGGKFEIAWEIRRLSVIESRNRKRRSGGRDGGVICRRRRFISECFFKSRFQLGAFDRRDYFDLMSYAIDPYDPCPCGSGEKYKFCC